MFQAVWRYRGFILGSIKREFQLRYRNSMLGMAWAVIQPLAMILVYTLIFTQIMQAKLPGVQNTFGYSIYLCAGILTWGFFSEIVNRSLTTFLDNANLLKKMSFPRLTLPVVIVGSASVNFIIIFALFLVFLVLTGSFPGTVVLLLIPVLIVQVMFAIGLGITLGILNVFFRDVGQLFSVVMQLWFWVTPIIYPISILPDALQKLMILNPMAGIISAYQDILVMGVAPDWNRVGIVMVIATVLCILGLYLFRKNAGEMVDEL